jgi:hypothetical protein
VKIGAIDAEGREVVVPIGANDGVQRLRRYSVFRKDTFVTKVEVLEVSPDECRARVLSDWSKQDLQEGDEVEFPQPLFDEREWRRTVLDEWVW